MNEMGFASRYKNDADFSIFIEMVVALSFVPIENLDAAIKQLGDDLPEYLQPSLDWFEDNYVGRVNRNGRGRRTALFPPHIWNLFIDADIRILKIVQSYDSRTKISFLRGIAQNISLH